MNANILLAMHNVRQYDLLFEMLRENMSEKLPGFLEAYIETNCIKKSEQKIISRQNTLAPEPFASADQE